MPVLKTLHAYTKGTLATVHLNPEAGLWGCDLTFYAEAELLSCFLSDDSFSTAVSLLLWSWGWQSFIRRKKKEQKNWWVKPKRRKGYSLKYHSPWRTGKFLLHWTDQDKVIGFDGRKIGRSPLALFKYYTYFLAVTCMNLATRQQNNDFQELMLLSRLWVLFPDNFTIKSPLVLF